MKSAPYGIHWFRRDLRVAGNPGLGWNLKQAQGRTLGIFFLDPQFLSRPDFSYSRFGFFLQTLVAVQKELRDLGGDLLVLDQGPDEGFRRVLSNLTQAPPGFVTFNRDYEPYARERDSRIFRYLEGMGIQVHTERDHLIIEPQEFCKDSKHGGFYQIYTPFSKKWWQLLQGADGQERIVGQEDAIQYLNKKLRGETIAPVFCLKWRNVFTRESPLEDCLDEYVRRNSPFVSVPLPKAGSLAAFSRLKSFQDGLKRYSADRDFPSLNATSRLSVYFKNGSITPAMVVYFSKLNSESIEPSQFMKELIWREFYYHLLYHRPNVETQAFLSQFRNIKWENNEKWFEAWKVGKTGYPIVDAGMRELNSTGLMHNRVRMIVASFLTKDLLIDWRWGERFFMNQLLDGDLAPNNGGWQWAASTGCDPQPYFRVFNPTRQSEKFDPEGRYIREFIPELRKASNKDVHCGSSDYLRPIVDHTQQREKAIALYKRHKQQM